MSNAALFLPYIVNSVTVHLDLNTHDITSIYRVWFDVKYSIFTIVWGGLTKDLAVE